jgi:hypothetical protein
MKDLNQSPSNGPTTLVELCNCSGVCPVKLIQPLTRLDCSMNSPSSAGLQLIGKISQSRPACRHHLQRRKLSANSPRFDNVHAHEIKFPQ